MMKFPALSLGVTLLVLASPLTADQDHTRIWSEGFDAGYAKGLAEGVQETAGVLPRTDSLFQTLPSYLAIPMNAADGQDIQTSTPRAIPLYGSFDFAKPDFWQRLDTSGAALGWSDGMRSQIVLVPLGDIRAEGAEDVTAAMGNANGIAQDYVTGSSAAFRGLVGGVQVLREAPMIGTRGLTLVQP